MIPINPPIIIAALIALIAFTGGVGHKAYELGYSSSEAKHLEANLKQLEKLAEAQKRIEEYQEETRKIYRQLQQAEAKEINQVEEKEDAIVTEVIKYITLPPDPDLYLDPRWVRIHNDAARPATRLPEGHSTFPSPDGRPATAGAVLSVVTRNYAKYDKCVAEHRALRAIIAAQ